MAVGRHKVLVRSIVDPARRRDNVHLGAVVGSTRERGANNLLVTGNRLVGHSITLAVAGVGPRGRVA